MTAPIGYTTESPLPSPGDADDRALASFRNLVRACLPHLALLGKWDYRIDSIASDTTVIASPVDTKIGLPGGLLVKLTPSHLGERIVPSVGARVVVEFLDGNQGKPIASLGDPDTDPLSAKLFGGTKGVARVDDGVAVGTLTVGGASGATLQFTPAGGSPGAATPSVVITAKISQGSLKLSVG